MLHRLARVIAFILLLSLSPILGPLSGLRWIVKGGPNVYFEAIAWSMGVL